jgi:hypothetical protein
MSVGVVNHGHPGIGLPLVVNVRGRLSGGVWRTHNERTHGGNVCCQFREAVSLMAFAPGVRSVWIVRRAHLSDGIDPCARFDPREGRRTERPIMHRPSSSQDHSGVGSAALACIHDVI